MKGFNFASAMNRYAANAASAVKHRIEFERQLQKLSTFTGQDVNKLSEIKVFVKEIRVLSQSRRDSPSKAEIISNLCNYVAHGFTLQQAMDRYKKLFYTQKARR